MFGCVGRIVVLAVLIILGAAAYVTRGRWEPKLRDKMGWKPAATTAAAPTWQPVTPAGAERVRASLAELRRPRGPVFTNVTAADLVAFALDSLLRGWGAPRSGATGAEALAGENTISIRGTINMKQLGGDGALGPLARVLEGDQPIEVRGRFELTGAAAQFRVERIAVANFALPSAAIGPIVRRIGGSARAGVTDGAFAVALPSEVADIRVTPGRVTLYKAAK